MKDEKKETNDSKPKSRSFMEKFNEKMRDKTKE